VVFADRGYDADWFRETLVDKGTKPCIPQAQVTQEGHMTSAVTNDATVFPHTFEGFKDWRCVAPRYDRSPTTVFLRKLAATVIFCYDPMKGNLFN
jgi:hypothetical protein